MRGKDEQVPQFGIGHGITPACAGKRMLVGECPKPLWDHPRVCGEKEIAAGRDVAYWGSPPRVRGKAAVAALKGHAAGITPAYAGKRLITTMMRNQLRDHPRVCGEKIPMAGNAPVRAGSPPRMRGKVHCPRSRLGRTRDHPRVCGEKNAASIWAICARGSPPRVRGKV